MANHYHLVLRVDRSRAEGWDLAQVAAQWEKLYHLPVLVSRYLKGETDTQAENRAAESIIETWRERLSDISWFMRGLNEHLARQANAEDGCSGRFWEGRFKSQALLDEAAVLTCMSYVDLNPIRAALAETPETSDFTSIQQRIRQYAQDQVEPPNDNRDEASATQSVPLMPLVKQQEDLHPNAIGFTTVDYLELVDWAGRAVREDKRGAIPEQAPPILQRLGIEPSRYLDHVQGKALTEQSTAIGHFKRMQQAAESFGRRFIKGIGEARRLYRPLAVT
jgi:hypothetical protein